MSDGVRCPSCRKLLEGRPETFPFCSERCKNVDLGRWFEEGYRVSRPLGLQDLDLELPEAESNEEDSD